MCECVAAYSRNGCLYSRGHSINCWILVESPPLLLTWQLSDRNTETDVTKMTIRVELGIYLSFFLLILLISDRCYWILAPILILLENGEKICWRKRSFIWSRLRLPVVMFGIISGKRQNINYKSTSSLVLSFYLILRHYDIKTTTMIRHVTCTSYQLEITYLQCFTVSLLASTRFGLS